MKRAIFILIIIIALVVLAVFIVVAYNKGGEKLSSAPKEVPVIPQKCQAVKDDTCALFSCVVNNCWCDENILDGPVLTETNEQIIDADDAASAVLNYLKSVDSEYVYDTEAVRLNDLFFNVFSYNKDNEERVLTISFDGKILETVCGI
jgi:ribose 5-phosphate isomerase